MRSYPEDADEAEKAARIASEAEAARIKAKIQEDAFPSATIDGLRDAVHDVHLKGKVALLLATVGEYVAPRFHVYCGSFECGMLEVGVY